MFRALITAGTGMVAQQTNLDVIANNLANVNTVGFKSQRAEFQDMVYQTMRTSGASTGSTSSAPTSNQVGLGTRYAGNSTNFGQGGLQATGNPMEVAIQGDGFFQIELPDGTTAYSRDGSFKRNANGDMVTSDGYRVLPGITIPANATGLSIAANGAVTAQLPGQDVAQTLATIQLATFPNPSGLTRVGSNLFAAGGASGEATLADPGSNGSGSLAASFVEGANVSIVEEMVRMILAQRAYEVNSKAIQTADDMLSTLNQLKR